MIEVKVQTMDEIEKLTNKVRPVFYWICPKCYETNDVSDDQFAWKNNRWEQRHLSDCDFCDLEDVQLYK